MAFKPITFNGTYNLMVATDGMPRTGKTRFAATAPDPIGVIALERNTRYTMAKHAQETGKKILAPEKDFIRPWKDLSGGLQGNSDLSSDAAIKLYRKHLDSLTEEYLRMLDDKAIRTVVIDTGTQLWEDILFAHFGKSQQIKPISRGLPNQEMKNLLNACQKNIIVIHKSKEKWVDDKPTGKFERSGYGYVAYDMNVCVQHYRDTAIHNKDCRVSEDGCVCWGIKISECQANPELIGAGDDSRLTGSRVTFAQLARRIFPDSSLKDWR